MMRLLLILASLLAMNTTAYARGSYQQPSDFISAAFDGAPPEAELLWLTDETKNIIENILQHSYKGQRIRYWQKNKRTAWVLDEVGKTKPITTGIIIENNKIIQIKVLIFRESRGWEVRHAFFTNQYIDATVNEKNQLDRTIDGISGATLSVRALTKQAQIALLLNRIINKP